MRNRLIFCRAPLRRATVNPRISARDAYFKFRSGRGRNFFSQIVARYDQISSDIISYMYLSVPQSQMDPVSLEELRSITPLAGLDLLHKVVGLQFFQN